MRVCVCVYDGNVEIMIITTIVDVNDLQLINSYSAILRAKLQEKTCHLLSVYNQKY